jgi:hypothetical protein
MNQYSPLARELLSSLHELGESPVPASSIVVSIFIVFLVYLCVVFRMVDIYMPVVECGYSILFKCAFHLFLNSVTFCLKGKWPVHFVLSSFLI